MAEMEMIPFAEVIKICRDFMEHPEDENAIQALDNLKTRLRVKTYLSLESKLISIYRMLVSSDRSNETDTPLVMMELEIASLLQGLLSYTNIEQNIPRVAQRYEIYDMMQYTGLVDYILSFCERDYNRLMRLLDRVVNFQNARDTFEVLRGINEDNISASLKAFKDFQQEADPALIQNLADIIKFNDPTLYKIKEAVTGSSNIEQLETLDILEKILHQQDGIVDEDND